MTKSPASKQALIDRRRFLQHGTLAGAAALMGPAGTAEAQSQASAETRAAGQSTTTPLMTAEAEAAPPAAVQVVGTHERSGSDYMVDVIKSLDFDYICANPGSSFRGLHESLINYGGNENPELFECG